MGSVVAIIKRSRAFQKQPDVLIFVERYLV